MFAICSLLVASALAQAPAAAQSGSICGRVTVAGAGTPISGARVTLVPAVQPAASMDRPPQATTDQGGLYIFNRVAPGEYYLHINKTGFAPLTPGSANLQLAAGQRLGDVDRQLAPGAVIAGRILDPQGKPMAGISVTAMQRMTLPGLPEILGRPPRLFPVGGARTNDLGEFRVAGLAPGEYVVAAMQEPSMMFGGPDVAASNAPRPTRGGHTTIVLTFYPGATDSLAAQAITVGAGVEVGNVAFVLQAAPAFRVSGIVVDEAGNPVAGAMVRLEKSSQDVMLTGPAGTATTRGDGRFEIDDVTPGTYQARAAIPITIGNTTTASWSTAAGEAMSRVRGGVTTGLAVSVSDGVGGGTFTASAGEPLARPTPPSEVLVVDADVTDLRVVALRPTRR